MADSPLKGSDGRVNFAVESDGQAVGDEVRLFEIHVRRAVGVIPTALLIVDDGNMPDGDWPVANGETFKPGAEITIKAGYGDQAAVIFKGIVVKLGVRIDAGAYSRLQVHCQDKAVKMTVGRKAVNYIDQKDSDIISTLIAGHNLDADVEATDADAADTVQYCCTDWDFIVARAEANGMLVIVEDGAVSVKAPQTSASPALSVTWGTDLVDFQAEVDARTQLSEVKAVSWDAKTQAVISDVASPPSLNAQGDLDSSTLAEVIGLDTYALRSVATLDASAVRAWAKAQQVKAGLARIRGRMRFQGSALAKVGGLIELAGVGERYKGNVFVGALEHELKDGNWFTQVEFGLPAVWFVERRDLAPPPASGWTSAAEGLQIGVVLKLDGDPKGENRIQVRVPVLEAQTEGVWARLSQYYASNTFGAFYLPEVGDEVVLGYFNNDPSNPIVLGSLYSSSRTPPYVLEAENNTKALVTRSKSKIEINDKDVIITITTPAANKIVISDKDKSILLSDENGNTVTMDSSGIALDSPGDIKVTAKGNVSVSAGAAISLTAVSDLTAKGLNVTAEAQVALTAKGAASAELSASGQTTVRGAMVMIN